MTVDGNSANREHFMHESDSADSTEALVERAKGGDRTAFQFKSESSKHSCE